MGSIVVNSDQDWYGSAGSGLSIVLVDGHDAGSLPPRGTVKVVVTDGEHLVQIRRLRLKSPIVSVHVSGDAQIVLVANTESGTFLRWSSKALSSPTRALNLRLADSPAEMHITPVSTRRTQNAMFLMNVVFVLGMVVGLLGLKLKWDVIEYLGYVGACLSFLTYLQLKRSMKKLVRLARQNSVER